MGFKGTPWSKKEIIKKAVNKVISLGHDPDLFGDYDVVCMSDNMFSVSVPLINGKSYFTVIRFRGKRMYNSIW